MYLRLTAPSRFLAPSSLVDHVTSRFERSADVLEGEASYSAAGRLMHHLQEIDGMSLKAVQYCVFDEADRLFEMGFAEQLKAILAKLSPRRQTLLFSATLPAALAEFARAGLKDPEFVRLDADNKLSVDLALAFFTIRYINLDVLRVFSRRLLAALLELTADLQD